MRFNILKKVTGSGSTSPKNRFAYIAHIKDIEVFPNADYKGVALLDDIVMKEKTGMAQIYITPSAQEYSYEIVGDSDSKSYKLKFLGTHPGTELEALEFVKNYLEEDFVVLIPSCDVGVKVLGTPDAPLRFTSSHKSDKDYQKFNFVFEQEIGTENVYQLYTGLITLNQNIDVDMGDFLEQLKDYMKLDGSNLSETQKKNLRTLLGTEGKNIGNDDLSLSANRSLNLGSYFLNFFSNVGAKIGINKNNPTEALDVKGNIKTDGLIINEDGGSDVIGSIVRDADRIKFKTSSGWETLMLKGDYVSDSHGPISPDTPVPVDGWKVGWYTPKDSSASPGTNYPNQDDLKYISGFFTEFYFDGNTWESIVNPMPVALPTGNVEESNSEAVSGGTVWDAFGFVRDVIKKGTEVLQFSLRAGQISPTNGVTNTSVNWISTEPISVSDQKTYTIFGYGNAGSETALGKRVACYNGSTFLGFINGGYGAEKFSFTPIALTNNIKVNVDSFTNVGLNPQSSIYNEKFKIYEGDEDYSITHIDSVENIDEDGLVTAEVIRKEIKAIDDISFISKNLLDYSKVVFGGYNLTGGNQSSTTMTRYPVIIIPDEWKGGKVTLSGYGKVPNGYSAIIIQDLNNAILFQKIGDNSTADIVIELPVNAHSLKLTIGTYDPQTALTLIMNLGDKALSYQEFGKRYVDGKKVIFNENEENDNNINFYLPKKLKIAVGRTIELYHNQITVGGDSYSYNYFWSGIGRKLGRKNSIAAQSGNIGNYTLNLDLISKNNVSLLKRDIEVEVVSNIIQNDVKVLCIGDSLTNSKIWLREIKNNLSTKIKFIGTRTDPEDSTYKHEGRSGYSAHDYLVNSTYSGDNYGTNGNDGRIASKNPFFNESLGDFDFNYYLSNYNVETPDIIVIWLGTNGLAGSVEQETGARKIKDLVDKIQLTGGSGIKILLCHTLIWSNQDGLAFQGSTDGFQSGNNYKLLADLRIVDLANRVEVLLKDHQNIEYVPLITCHDSAYNYGKVEFAANPRSSEKVYYPNQAVHPQSSGYLQCADVIFSAICGVVN